MTTTPKVEEPFVAPAQQREADMLGMYIFLASEIMLFSGLFAGLIAYRILHPHEIVEASRRLHLWIGAINTAVLLTSSLAVALAVQASRLALRRFAIGCLASAAVLGFVFLGLKALEYSEEYREGLLPVPGVPHRFSGPVEELFMNLYLVGTGLHAIHLTIGILLLLGLSWRLWRRTLPLPQGATTTTVIGLYWHLVDIVWIFLFPVLYLAR